MKTKDFLLSMLAFVMVATLSMGVSSCGDNKDPEPNPEQTIPSILVNGLTESSLSFEGNFEGKSGIDFKQTVTISSNVAWSLSGVPDWLSVSPTNGNGTITMTIYPKSQNETSSSRNATLILTGDGVSATINIVQGNGLSLCYVEPTNIVALYNSVAWDFQETGNVNKFQYMILSERECNMMTEKEMKEKLNEEESLKYAYNYFIMTGIDVNRNLILENTAYYIVTLAYDEHDKAGELRKAKVTTPVYLNGDKDAWVSFDNIKAYSDGFQFDATKEGYCNTYHIIYGAVPSNEYYYDVLYAFEINYYLKNRKKHFFAEQYNLNIETNYPNNHTFTYYKNLIQYPRIVIFGWGVFNNGSLSSDLTGGQWDLTQSVIPQKVVEQKGNNTRLETKIISLEELKRK